MFRLVHKKQRFCFVIIFGVLSAICAANGTDRGDSGTPKEMNSTQALLNQRIVKTTFRTYLMGIWNFAEALGKFLPSDQFMKSENNTSPAELTELFDILRRILKTVQHVTLFLENFLENGASHEGSKQITQALKLPEMFKSLRSTFSTMRGIAGQILNTYNYYFPEISYTRCLGKFVKREYPAVLAGMNFENAVRLVHATYRYAMEYIRGLMAGNDSTVGTKVAEMSSSDFSDYQGQQAQQDYVERQSAYQAQQDLSNYQIQNLYAYQGVAKHDLNSFQGPSKPHLYTLYRPNSKLYNTLEARTSRRVDDDSVKTIGYAGPRQFGELPLQEDEPEQNSVFNFDEIMKQRLGMKAEELGSLHQSEENESFGRCTQSYALEVFWRTIEGFLSKDN